jgi:RNA recognition motif-containing protein
METMQKIFVGRLPRSAEEQTLDELFSAFGDVHRTQIVRNVSSGRSRLFGFVEMLDQQDARRAIEALDGAEVDGSTLTVRQADNNSRIPRSPGPEVHYRDVCLRGVPYETTEQELKEMFGALACRVLVSPTGMSTGIAFLTFPSAAEAEQRAKEIGGLLV